MNKKDPVFWILVSAWISVCAIMIAGCGDDSPTLPPNSQQTSGQQGTRTPMLRDAQVKQLKSNKEPAKTRLTGHVLGQAGTVAIDLSVMREAVAEARVLRHWQTGKKPELAALENPRLRQKVLVRALETRLVRQEFERRNLEVDPLVLEGLLVRAAQGVAPEKRLNQAQDRTLEIDALKARIEARFGIPFSVVRRVALDLVEHRTLSHALMNGTADAEIRREWEASQNCLDATLYRIPRVPTSSEIDEAVRSRTSDIATYYAENGRLFRTPARTFVKRLLIPVENADKKTEVRARLKTLRGEVSSEASMTAAINAHGFPRDRRNGGRKTISKKQRPDLYEKAVGSITEIEAHSLGWVFYFIEGHGSEVVRSLDDRRVKREIAAAILRRDDRLIHAKQVAGRLAYKLRRTPRSETIKTLLKKERIRTVKTGKFCRTNQRTVPGIGLAPELSKILFSMNSAHAVTRPVKVRQDYIVGALHSYEAPTETDWASVKMTYIPEWKRENAPHAIKAWLAKNPAAQGMRVNSPRLKALSVDEFRLSESSAD